MEARLKYAEHYDLLYPTGQIDLLEKSPPPKSPKKQPKKKLVNSQSGRIFTDLCDDVIRIVCSYLDVESHIALYLAAGKIECVRENIYRKIAETQTVFASPTSKRDELKDCNLVSFISQLPNADKIRLLNACDGYLPIKLSRGLNSLLPLLTEHDKIPNYIGIRRRAKAYHGKFGTMRANTEAYNFVEGIAVAMVFEKPAHHLFKFVLSAFDIAGWVCSYQRQPTNLTPGCFQTPEKTLKAICRKTKTFTLRRFAIKLWHCYVNYKKFYEKPRNGIDRQLIEDANNRYLAALKIMFTSLYIRAESSYPKLRVKLEKETLLVPLQLNNIMTFVEETLCVHVEPLLDN